jgi:hypothetical protein
MILNLYYCENISEKTEDSYFPLNSLAAAAAALGYMAAAA